MDSRAKTAPRVSEIIKELHSRETHGFDSPRDAEIINEVL